MADIVPTASSLSDIYPQDVIGTQQQRWNDLIGRFVAMYGQEPVFISRSPGRVNIIGEHIDYSLYEVMPMAINADVLLAVRVVPDSQAISIANVDFSRFPSREILLPKQGQELEIDASSHEWSNYFKAGLRGVLETTKRKMAVGMQILADGTVPSGAGLSSSAAFVCASALAVMKANGVVAVDKKELVELAIVSERSVGVHSGGMDQSASVLASRDSALYVKFKPSLEARPVSFPAMTPAITFVIAQTFVAADKHVTAPECYNLRVMECTLAAAVLAKKLGLVRPLPKDPSPLGMSLRGLHDTYFEETQGITSNVHTEIPKFKEQLQALVELVKANLHGDGYTREDLCSALGISLEQLNSQFLSRIPIRAERFLLRQRAQHVFTEALRVLQFQDLLSHPPASSKELPKLLGAIMNDCQTSCRELYANSCAELDELCELARTAGSLGSRLTGAGWGGCTVHLVPTERVDKLKEAWKDGYYLKKFPDITKEKLGEAIVVSEPGSGSSVYFVQDHGLA